MQRLIDVKPVIICFLKKKIAEARTTLCTVGQLPYNITFNTHLLSWIQLTYDSARDTSWRNVNPLLHKSSQSKAQAVDDAEVIAHRGPGHRLLYLPFIRWKPKNRTLVLEINSQGSQICTKYFNLDGNCCCWICIHYWGRKPLCGFKPIRGTTNIWSSSSKKTKVLQ